ALKVRFVVELGGGSKGTLRVGGVPHAISPARAAPRPEAGLSFAPNTGVEILSAFPATIVKSSSVDGAGRPGSIISATVSTAAASQSTAPSISSSSRLVPSTTSRPSSHQKAIQTLIRRSYTYFTALLQEPDQKWKPLLESRGVTVTQLDSIDPTLVVYRAEATFVGVGVWDLLGALGCEPARGVWERGVEDVRLVEDVNELTELWWVKMRAAWPVNPRDTLLLKTSYKSPTAAHVFSFSTTDTTLFPTLPPPELPTIRTHVDLHGFAIEALSPTTTLLTLLEQSRAKTGAAGMVATLAGIGEMVIRGGGAPPVVSRLSGARKTRVRYEHERGVWRVEYERCERGAGGGSVDDGEKEREKERKGRRGTMRREEKGEDEEVDELRTASDARPVPERSPTSQTVLTTSRPPTLIVNGARVKVDVEELAEGEAKALARAKRVKPTRIPLDEPQVAWTRRARGDTIANGESGAVNANGETDTEAEASGTGTTAGGGGGGGGFKWGMGMGSLGLGVGGSLGLGMGGLGKMWAPAGGNAGNVDASPVLGLSAPDVQSGVESPAQPSTLLRLVTNTNTPISSAVPTVSAPPPMASALDALTFLARQHAANPTPDAIPTADGWAPVNTKAGLTVTRRTESAFSSTLPVHRCAKVLQGVSAEDVAGAITSAGSRRQWDTWFDGGASAVLEEYGAGARTEFSVLKGGFPFRDRGFYVSSVTARAGSSGKPALIFLASSSYAPEGVQQFAPAKVNPYSLPVGQMPLYGWVIETLDPYTAENYAIPSARCTLYVCVDYGGQVPATYNAMVNATLPRASIAGVEAFLGGGARASVPVVRYPASVMAVVREDEEEAAKKGLVWTLGNEDQRRTFLGSSYSSTTNVFQASVRLSPYTVRSSVPSPQMPVSAIEPSSSGSMLLSVGSYQRKVSSGGSSPNGASGSGNGASWGRAAGRLAMSPRHRSRTLSSPAKAPMDALTVAEFI
ncbi:hypothetical protein FRC07_009270, partial [Ceratobasidium sp. 392]